MNLRKQVVKHPARGRPPLWPQKMLAEQAQRLADRPKDLAEALVELTDIENRCQHLPELGAIWTSIDAARKLFEAEAAIGPEGD